MTATFRARILAGCILLTGLAFIQQPGLLTSDTKLDLAEDPGAFLGRALHLWDPQGGFGQVQNQAYGYWWPMGPFFWLGDLLQLPGWAVQRGWLALVLAVAFSGAAAVARELGVRGDAACLVSGVAYALSPRMLTVYGPISIEAWPAALAPWVLLALMRGSRQGSPRRWAALAALGVAMVGGVNAAATLAVLPLGVVWLLTREPGPRRRSLMLWWPVFTLLGTLWWLVPLLLLGAYSPAFLDYIETTEVTTFPTTLFDTLRGTSDWVPYVDPGNRIGNDLLTSGYLAIDAGAVLALGLVGLLLPRIRHRAFLVCSLAAGILMVTAGHHGAVAGWFSGELRTMLDGSLAPLRNVHKFDPIVRLPLVLGLGFLVDRVLSERSTDLLPRINRASMIGLTLVALAGSIVPAAAGRIPPAGATLGVPDYWVQTADWLADHDDGRTALLAPGSTFADYQWGVPEDEPLQWLARSRWAVRNVIPLAPEGNIRMLDAVQQRLAQGDGSAGLTALLARSGVGRLVVRNDLAPADGVPDPATVHQALADSPGIVRVATFGPTLGGDASLEADDGSRVVVNGGWQARYPAVEVYAVSGAAAAVDTADPAVVVGGPEDLGDLSDLGVLGTAPAVLAGDLPDDLPEQLADALPERPRVPLVLTDGLRSRERSFARIVDASSATRAAGEARSTQTPAEDYLPRGWAPWRTVASISGADAVTASSSASDAGTAGGSRRGEQPLAAIDGDGRSAWSSGRTADAPAWWELRPDRTVVAPRIEVLGARDAPDRQVLRVVTDRGAGRPLEVGPGERRRFTLPEGRADRIRIEDASGVAGREVAIAEVDVPGVSVERRLVLPRIPESWGDPDVIALRRDTDARSGCAAVGVAVRCVAGRDRGDEEPTALRRDLQLYDDARWDLELRVSPRRGRALEALTDSRQLAGATASSVAVPDPRASALAAVDGDPGTSWAADPDDLRPTLRLRWVGQRRVTGVRIALEAGAPARAPTRLRVTWDDGSRVLDVRDGRVRMPAVRTDHLDLEVMEDDGAVSIGFDGATEPIGVGIGEVRVDGVPALPISLAETAVDRGCGSGPVVEVAGARFATAVRISDADLLGGRPAPARLCDRDRPRTDPVEVPAGDVAVDVVPSPAFNPDSLVLRRTDAPNAIAASAAGATAPDPVNRTVAPGPGKRLVVLRENTNPGWTARVDGHRLEPVVVDGWQQGFWIPEDADGPVRVTYAPDRPYRIGLLVGMLTLLALGACALRGGRSRDDPEPLGERRLSRRVAVAGALLVAGLVASWGGLLVGVLVANAVLFCRRFVPAMRESLPWLLAAPALLVGAAYAVRPWGSASGWAGEWAWTGYLMLVPLVGVLVAAGRSGTRPLSRRAGRSTTR